MKRKHSQRPTMSDIVSDSQASPPKTNPRRLPPGVHDDLFIDQNGLSYRKLEKDVSPDTAIPYVTDGAQVVFDECGCGGICGLVFLTDKGREGLAKKRPTLESHKGQKGLLSLWRSEEGFTLLLAQGPVRWT
jgi:hypothetical protein